MNNTRYKPRGSTIQDKNLEDEPTIQDINLEDEQYKI